MKGRTKINGEYALKERRQEAVSKKILRAKHPLLNVWSN